MSRSTSSVSFKQANSTPAVLDHAVSLSTKLGMAGLFEESTRGIEDDHVAFIKSGIPAVDLIDFKNIQFWHKAGDDPNRVSFQSIEKVSRVALGSALTVAYSPEIYAN